MSNDATHDNRASTGPWTLAFFGVTVAVLALAVAVVGLWLPTTGERAAGSAAGSSEPLTVQVTLDEMVITPASIEVAPGQEVILEVENIGTMPHDVKVNGTDGSSMLDPGDTETVELGSFDQSTEAWCTVPGHKEAGMVMDIIVTGASSGGDQVASGGDDAAAANFAEVDPNAAPAADWQPYDPKLEPAPGGTEHKITLRATETVMEVAPGVTQELWTFNDMVPGPTLRGKVGDLFTVTLINEGEIGHSIDFHASKVAWDDEMRTINKGEELVYQFRADFAGAYMYHCGTNPTLHHIGNGMHGAIIIDPPELAPVDHEFRFVQSEFYLGPEGEPGDLTKMMNDEWDIVSFNGYHNQYVHAPIRVETGDRVRVWVVNNGPSENSSFHIVGTVFDTVFKEGTYTLRPDDRRGGSQALDLQPAQGGFVEFDFAEDGFYPLVTHKFSNPGKGALGFFQAGDVTLPEGAGH